MSLKIRHNFFYTQWINLLTKSRLYKYQFVRINQLIFSDKNNEARQKINLCFKAEIFTPENRRFAILFPIRKINTSVPDSLSVYQPSLPDSYLRPLGLEARKQFEKLFSPTGAVLLVCERTIVS